MIFGHPSGKDLTFKLSLKPPGVRTCQNYETIKYILKLANMSDRRAVGLSASMAQGLGTALKHWSINHRVASC